MPRRKDDVRTTISFNGGPELEVDLKKAAEKIGAHDRARSYVDRFVRLLQEKADLAESIADLKTEAKGAGFVPKALVELAKREMETAEQRAKRVELAEEIERLEAALGVFVGTPLGRSAVSRAGGGEAHA
jgi:uncharacterized protein (UPF0335 family)